MKYEKWQEQEQVTSDGESTIGYVNSQPAEWDGNAEDLQSGDYYIVKDEGSTFGVNTQDEFHVEDGKWKDADGNIL